MIEKYDTYFFEIFGKLFYPLKRPKFTVNSAKKSKIPIN